MRTALVNMPFGFHIYPSIQLGTLSSLLKSHGWPVDSHYLNLHFAQKIGIPVYNQLCEKRFLIGEWLFSEILFGDAPGNRAYPEHFRDFIQEVSRSIGQPPEFLLEIKTRLAPEFLHWAVQSVDWSRYGLVGFTSTFNQNIASVTLARLIKEAHPQVKIIFGGSNFESEMGMEYFRVFDWIDYAVTGEAEPVLPAAMQAIEQGGPMPPGLLYRQNGDIAYRESPEASSEFTRYPLPDYDDYFKQLREIDPHSHHLENPVVLYETARGCWWGEKHHCTFCGLNASTMKFRSKPVEQVERDIAELSRKYDTFRFRLVDNILEMSYIDDLFARFAEAHYDFQFFLEVKSNLSRQQIKTLAHGGTNVIQPGIESFSANQLIEMDKGVRPIQNIMCLKWSMYYGVEVAWNILTGFPGETDDDYRRQIDTLKSLIHFQPPIGVGTLWLERFSPYFTRPDEYGVTIKGPGEAYPYVYDGSRLDLMKIAYDFEFEVESRVDPRLKQELQDVVAAWQARHRSEHIPYLFFTRSVDFVTVYDGRPEGAPVKSRYEGPMAGILLYCNERPRGLEQIREHLEEQGIPPAAPGQLEEFLNTLLERRLLFEERGKYLTLAMPHNAHL